MSDDLQQARVEAAGEAIYEEVVTSTDLSMSDCERIASDALAAADAVVTVEMIAEAIAKVTDMWDEPLDEVYDIPPIARAILDLIRGETETNE